MRTHFFYKKRTQLLCPGKYTRARVSFTSFTPVSFRPTFHLSPFTFPLSPFPFLRPAHTAYTRTRETPHHAKPPHCPIIRPLSHFYPPRLIKSISRPEKTAQSGYFTTPHPPFPGSLVALYALLGLLRPKTLPLSQRGSTASAGRKFSSLQTFTPYIMFIKHYIWGNPISLFSAYIIYTTI